MCMPHTIPEAGCDVDAVDPDVVTRKEALVMPSRKRTATPSASSGSAEGGTFDTPRCAAEQAKQPTPSFSPPRKHAKRPGTFPGAVTEGEADAEEHQSRPQRTLNL